MRVIAVPEYCLGCGLCEIYCAAQHDGYAGNVLRAYKRGKPLSRSRLLNSPFFLWFNTCMHCENAPCINACISGAMKRDENNIVYVDEDKCVGCYTCVMVCPYGHIKPLPGQKQVLKCDLCRGENIIPACVAHCPNEALKLVD